VSTPGDKEFIDYFLPIVADAEAGFGGVLNAFELMKNMIAAGAAGVHFEDQLAAVKKCGHMGGKVLVPTSEAVEKLISARFAADVMGVSTIVLARTDAEAANLITSRPRRQRQAIPDRRAHPRRLLPRQERSGTSHQPWRGLRSLRRPGVVRNRRARHRLCP
jgi:isocitrate lyase